jgi:anthranilate synthase component 1
MTEFDEFCEKARTANVVAVVETMPADLLTPLAVYLKLSGGRGGSFLLESVEGGETLARYSFVGVDPHFTATGGRDRVYVKDRSGTSAIKISMLDFIRDHFGKYKLHHDERLPIFSGGAIGALGFSCSAWFEPSLRTRFEPADDDAAMMFCRTVVAFDHAKQLIQIVTLVFTDEADNRGDGSEHLYREALNTNSRIRKTLETMNVRIPRSGGETNSQPVTSNFMRADFENAVLKIKELIVAGEAYQVVLSQCFSRPTSVSAVSIYRALRSLNPSPYMFLLQINGKAIIGASPEMLVRSRGHDLEYRAIAGTRPRGKTPEDDAVLADEMRADQKEVAEHLMLVDLGRNDLGRVAIYGSVEVSGLMSVEKYSHVQHLVSNLSAELREGLDRFDALAACFPAGTVSGAPKVRAIEIINELEPTPRGNYSGAVGYFDYSGNMDTCIAIRTMVLEDGVAKVQAGAGIVADSDPAAEYQETVNKAKALLKAIDIAEENSL